MNRRSNAKVQCQKNSQAGGFLALHDSAIRVHSSAAFIKMPVRCQQPLGLSHSGWRTAAVSGVAIRKEGLVEELASLE